VYCFSRAYNFFEFYPAAKSLMIRALYHHMNMDYQWFARISKIE